MEHHNTALTNKLHAKPHTTNQPELPEKHLRKLNALSAPEQQAAMVRLWERMRSAFGQRWVREYGEVNGAAYEDWRDVLGPLSLNQLKQGLQATLESGSAHPPNLSEFTKACMVTKRSGVKPENQKYLESKKQTRMPPNVQAEQRKVSRKSTDRDASFCDSYYALGLHTRWGKLDPEKEREWRSRG